MKKIKNWNQRLSPVLAAALCFGMLTGCGNAANGTEPDTEPTPAANADAGGTLQTNGNSAGTGDTAPSAETDPATTASPATAAIRTEGATAVTFSGNSAVISGSGAVETNGVVRITDGGTYILSGTGDQCQVIVDAKGEDVVLELDGLDLTSDDSSPIYIYKAASAVIYLAENSENVLTDGESYSFSSNESSAADEEPNACLYSKADLGIQGSGALTVNANYHNGITGKDTLSVSDATLTVNAVNHGITGKDSLDLANAQVSVVSGGDGLRSTNDTGDGLGWVRLTDCTLTLETGEDGVQAETGLWIDGGSYTIATGGGCTVRPSDETSAKGLKSGGELTVSDGSFNLDCSDDALHANGSMAISGGSFQVASYDDAFHADETLTISGGEIAILTSYEGLEGQDIMFSGGTVYLIASDDGVNVAGGRDSSGFGGWGPGNRFGADSGGALTISGGFLYAAAGGDGLDSNGSITMDGGTVIVTSTGNQDGALDYEQSFTVNGGTLLAMDTGRMPASPTGGTQNTIFLNPGTTLAKGSYVALESDQDQIVFQLPIDTGSLVYSAPELTNGATYTVSSGGTYSGTVTDCIGNGGSYTGGTVLTELTLSETVTTYGSTGMGWGGAGRPNGGRFDEGGAFGRTDGTTPEFENGREFSKMPNFDEDREFPEIPDFDEGREFPEMPDFDEGRTFPEMPDFAHGGRSRGNSSDGVFRGA